MGRQKRTRKPEASEQIGLSRGSSLYSSSSTENSPTRSARSEGRFKRLMGDRKQKKHRKHPSIMKVDDNGSLMGRTSSYQYSQTVQGIQSRSNCSTSSSFSNRPAEYKSSINPYGPQRTRSSKSQVSESTLRNTNSQLNQHPSTSSRYRKVPRNPIDTAVPENTEEAVSSIHQSKAPQSQPAYPQQYYQPPPRKASTRRTRDLPASLAAPTVARTPSQHNAQQPQRTKSHKVPRRPVHSAPSLEKLNMQEFGTPTLMLKRKQSVVSIRGSRIKRFFLRIFRRRPRARFYYSKAQLRRKYSFNLPGNGGTPTQYNVRSVQLLGVRPIPRTHSVARRPVRGLISEPIQVTKHSGIDNTGNGEVLSIYHPRSNSFIRVRNPPIPPGANPQHMVNPPPRPTTPGSGYGMNEYDTMDRKLEQLQQDLDEARKLHRRLSRKASLASNGSFRYGSLNREKSFISLTSQVLPTLENHPDIIRRSDLFKRKSIKYGAGHMSVPPSTRKISRMDIESTREPEKMEQALAFVNTWSEYLRRAIAVRIVLRQEIKSLEAEEEMEWEQLNNDDDEHESYIDEAESLNSFHSSTSKSSDSQQRMRSLVANATFANFASTNPRTTVKDVNSSSTNNASSVWAVNKDELASLTPPAIPAYSARRSFSDRNSSLYSTADEVLNQGDTYYDDNGEMVSITPISSRPPSQMFTSTNSENVPPKRSAQSIRRALRQGQMQEKYAALMGSTIQTAFVKTSNSSTSPEKDLPPTPLRETRTPSRNNSQTSDGSGNSFGSFSKPGKESIWMRSSSSSRKSSLQAGARPLPPIPPGTSNQRVVSESRTFRNQELISRASSESSASLERPLIPDVGQSKDVQPPGIPRLLRQQRKMSDKILADMVQEMEDLQARSIVLSGMAKNQREMQDPQLGPQSHLRVSTTSEGGSSSDMSLSPVNRIPTTRVQTTERPVSAYYVLGPQQDIGTTVGSAAGIMTSSSGFIPGGPGITGAGTSRPSYGPLITNQDLYLSGVPKLQTGEGRSGSSGSSLQDENAIPRKISRAESIAAAAQVNLKRGKVNRRRPRSQRSSGRSSEVSSDSDVRSNLSDHDYRDSQFDLQAPPTMAMANMARASSSSPGSLESNDRLITTWVSMDMVQNH